MPACGSLFSGAGLLDFGLHLAGWEHAWLCESDEFRRDLLRKRFPGAVVYDDVRTVCGEAAANTAGAGRVQLAELDEHPQGHELPPRRDAERRGVPLGGVCASVDLIAGGFPCRGVSSAGKRQGFDNAETVLWHEMRRIIREVRPRYVLIENVAAILGMAASPSEPAGSLWGTVLGDLAEIGPCHIVWDCIPAGAVGAPHLRDRLFAVASYSDRVAGSAIGKREGRSGAVDEPGAVQRTERPDRAHRDAADTDAAHDEGHWRAERVPTQVTGDHRERAGASADAASQGGQEARTGRQALGGTAPGCGVAEPPADAARDAEGGSEAPAGADRERVGQSVDWGDYLPAIQRWEHVHGPAPAPLVARVRGVDARRAGRVDRSRLSALGDGVCVHVAHIVGEYVMSLEHARLARQAA